MSAEKIMYEKQNHNHLTTSVESKVKFSSRVDINNLWARARKEKEKENKVNLVFFSLTAVLVIIVGIILSF